MSVSARDNVKRGGVEVEKRDIESDKADGLGAATLDGTTFQVKSLNDNPVMVNGVKRAKGDVVATLVIKDGRASTRADLLPPRLLLPSRRSRSGTAICSPTATSPS